MFFRANKSTKTLNRNRFRLRLHEPLEARQLMAADLNWCGTPDHTMQDEAAVVANEEVSVAVTSENGEVVPCVEDGTIACIYMAADSTQEVVASVDAFAYPMSYEANIASSSEDPIDTTFMLQRQEFIEDFAPMNFDGDLSILMSKEIETVDEFSSNEINPTEVLSEDGMEVPVDIRSMTSGGVEVAIQSIYRNALLPTDVDGDSYLSAVDLLAIFNSMNQFGFGRIEDMLQINGFDSSLRLDVNGDQYLTPLDSMIVINSMNEIEVPFATEEADTASQSSRLAIWSDESELPNDSMDKELASDSMMMESVLADSEWMEDDMLDLIASDFINQEQKKSR